MERLIRRHIPKVIFWLHITPFWSQPFNLHIDHHETHFTKGQASSDSHTGDSDFCYPAATACCLCLPPTSVFSSNYASSRSNQNKYQYNKANQRSHHHHHSTRHNQNSSMNSNHHYFHQPVKHSMVIATVFVFFTLAFVGLSYFAFNLQGQISTLSMHLEPGKKTWHSRLFTLFNIISKNRPFQYYICG